MNAERRWWKRWYLVYLLGAVLGVAWITHDVLSRVRERARREKCCSILKSIGCVLHLYSGDYKDRGSPFPPDLGVLFEDYITDGVIFLCPSAGKATEITLDKYTPGMPFDMYTDYVYVSGLRADDPPGYVTTFDDRWNHAGDGAFAVRIGGQVEWWSDFKALRDQLARQKKELAAQGRKMTIRRPPWSSWPGPPAP